MKLLDWLLIIGAGALFINGLLMYRNNPCLGCGKNCEGCLYGRRKNT